VLALAKRNSAVAACPNVFVKLGAFRHAGARGSSGTPAPPGRLAELAQSDGSGFMTVPSSRQFGRNRSMFSRASSGRISCVVLLNVMYNVSFKRLGRRGLLAGQAG